VQVPFRVRARELAHGWSAGAHRASRKGSGIEFAGHRAYTPGDDLRHLDHHALLRHGRLLIREFHTDTERAVHILVDVTASMQYASQQIVKTDSVAENKAERALLIAAALAYLAHSTGDALGLSWVDSERTETIPPHLGNDWFERILHELETLYAREKKAPTPVDKVSAPLDAENEQKRWRRVFAQLGVALPRGTVVVALSDFLDLDAELSRDFSRLSSRRRSLRSLQILCDDEASFPFDGAVRLQDPETGREVETDAKAVRDDYLRALREQTEMLRTNITSMGGTFERHLIEDAANDALRRLSLGSELR
jgi:uncharacterized protein (DUF58 family)